MPVSRLLEYPIDVGVYQSESLPVANQLCRNVIPWQEQTEGASTRGFLTYGFGIEVANAVNGQARALHNFAGVLYAVIGSTLYRVDTDDSITDVGTFTGSGSEDPIIADNGETLVIQFPKATGWFFDLTNGLVEITDSAYTDLRDSDGGWLSVTHIDGFFVYLTKKTMLSGSVVTTNGGKDFDALDFLKPFLSDNAIRGINIRDELYVFGGDKTKVYSTFETGAFPFVEIEGAGFDKGLLHRRAVLTFDNSGVFIGGGDGEQASVWRILGGGGVGKISTPFIDSRINALDPGDVETNFTAGFKFNIDGHFYAGFTVGPTLSAETFFYDSTSSALKGRSIWFQKESFGVSTDWLVRDVEEAYGRFYTVASSVGIGKLSKDVFTDYGFNVVRQFAGYYLENNNIPLFVDSVELVMESGVGNQWLSTTTPDRDPQITLEVSDDGGRTFFSMGDGSMGTYRDFEARAKWEGLGLMQTTMLFRFTMEADVKAVFTRLLVTAELGY